MSIFRQLEEVGGAEEDRTPDPLLAKQVLSQLSYSPIPVITRIVLDAMVGLGRFELPTSPLSGVRSNQLSYRPGIAQNCWPDCSFSLLIREVSRTRLNMRSGYAASDHRANTEEAEKGLYQNSQSPVRDRQLSCT